MSLISEIRQDLDASALQLITEYRDRLFAEAVRLSADVSAAEDLVSRTLDKAIRNLESHHKDESVFGWMKTIMLNLHRNDMRSPVRRGTAPVDPSVLEEYSKADWTTDEEILKRSDSQALREAIGRLDPEFKKTMVLHYLSELPVKQIAVVMNVPVGTVLWRLNIARKILARDLGGKLGKKPVAVLLAVLLGVGSLFGAWKVAEAIWPNDLTEKKEAETDMNANVMKSGAAAVLAAVGLSGAPMAVSAAVPPAYAGEAGCICYVNPKTGNDQTAVKNSTDLKFQTIQAAIDACDENGIVRLDDGTYEISAEIGLNKGIALVGNGWDKCVIKRTANYCRVIKMDFSSPTLYGVTVTGGKTFTAWAAGSGAGVYMESGTVSWCCVSNNWAAPFHNNVSGGGVCIQSGTIDHSIIVDNKSANASLLGKGGGIGTSTDKCGEIVIDTCLVYGNTACSSSGGGIYAGAAGMKIRNTTVAKNTGENSKGGGIYFDNADVTVENCIFADNSAPNDATVFGGVPNWSAKDQSVIDGVASRSSSSLFGSPATVALGQGSKVGSAHFKSLSAFDFHLEANSDANGLGVWYDGIANDLEDKPRKDVPAAGCYESDSSSDPFSCLVNSFAATAFPDDLVAFSATPVNPPAGAEIVYTWHLTNQLGHVETFVGNPASVTLAPGTYSVAVRASAGGVDSELGVSEETIQVAVRTNFVTSVENPDAAFPYDTSKTATTSLQEAIATAIGGTTIILDGGEHVVTSQIVLDKGVTIIGAGRDLTTVRRGAGKFQMLYLNHANATVSNLTLSGAWYDERWATGAAVVFGTLGGTVTDCRICEARVDGESCSGAAVYMQTEAAVMDRCLIENCTNTATTTGGGLHRAGMIYVVGGNVRNTLVTKCVSTGCAGIAVATGGAIDNCTFVANEMSGTNNVASTVGLAGGNVRNCIFSGNVSPADKTPDTEMHGKPDWMATSAGNVSLAQNCCWVDSSAAGIGHVGTNVMFRNAAEGDYHLLGGSSCRNAGLLLNWMAGALDLDGNPRRYGRAPDVGCFELQYGPGLLLLLR